MGSELGLDAKGAVVRIGAHDAFVEVDGEVVVIGGAAIIFQRFGARGLDVDTRKRDVADLQPLARREKSHVGGIVEKRIDQTALFDHEQTEPRPRRLDAARQARRPRTNDQYIQHLRHSRVLL